MTTTKTERAGVGFGLGQQAGSTVIEVIAHHDTIPAFRGIQVSFELLNGISPQQAKKILEVLNENVIGVLVTSASEDKTAAAAQ